MVATINTRKVALVTRRRGIVNQASLTPAEWEVILVEAAGTLTMDYLHGLRSFQQVFTQPEGFYDRVYSDRISIRGLLQMKVVVCATLQALPTIDSWPRKPSDPGEEPGEYLAVTEELILLERRRDGFGFWRLVSRSRPHPTKHEHSWCLMAESATAEEVSLRTFLEERGTSVGRSILYGLLKAQQDTTARLNERLVVSREHEFELTHFLRTLGEPL